MIYLQLLLLSLAPIACGIGFYFLEDKTPFKRIPYKYRQLIIGVVYGGCAILSTELGVNIEIEAITIGGAQIKNATANIRDAAPILAGLMFGGPAGIIAGVIGGVERFFAAYWGKGMLTQWACSISTVIAGVYAAALRKFMFDNKRASWGFGIAVAIVMEVIHFTLVFLTNMSTPSEIMKIIKGLSAPMIIANAFAVAVPLLVAHILNFKEETKREDKRKVSNQVKWWLLFSILACYAVSTGIVYSVQTNTAYQNADATFKLTINDVETDVKQSTDAYIKEVLDIVKDDYNEHPYDPSMTEPEVNAIRIYYNSLCNQTEGYYSIHSLDIVKKDEKGTFVASSDLGFDMSTFWMTMFEGQSKELHKKMYEEKYEKYVQEFSEPGDPEEQKEYKMKKYAAVTLGDEYYLIISFSDKQFYYMVDTKVAAITTYRHVNESGHILILNTYDEVVGCNIKYAGQNPGITLSSLQKQGKEYTRLSGNIFGTNCFYTYTTAETYTIVIVLPYNDVLQERDSSFILNTFMQVIAYAALFTIIYFLIQKKVVKNIETINKDLDEITNGNLGIRVNVKSSTEFEALSKDINSTVDALKKYIDDATKRIDDELDFAKKIQASALPSIFPAFPNNNEFDLYASMSTAKQVGGDFYDYYIIDGEHVAFVVADVSGKGIPAAMFMMESKAMIQNLAKMRLYPEDILTKANDLLAENNEANMFVTCWLGILNFKTGHVRFANAGHNAPLIHTQDGKWEYINQKKNIVLAAMPGMEYDMQEFYLKPGEQLYLYTDGVTEATRIDGALYGEDRLKDYLNNNKHVSLKGTLNGVKSDIDKFVEGADQFDDITMLTIQYFGDIKY